MASFRAGDSLGEYLQICERVHLVRTLERHNGMITASAAELGISRKNLWEKMRKLGIAAPHAGDAGKPSPGPEARG